MAYDPRARTEMFRAGAAESVPDSQPSVPVVVSAEIANESAQLLELYRSRLRQGFFILLGVYIAFLARDLLISSNAVFQLQFGLLLAAAAGQAGILFAQRRVRATWATLGFLEWATLAIVWGQQSVNQFYSLSSDADLQPGEWSSSYQVLLGNTWMIPWFALLAGYPVLIPNGPRRTALIVTITAVLPIAVTLLAGFANPRLHSSSAALIYVQYFVWGSVGVSIAIYGSNKAARLRQEAFEAKQFGSYKLLDKIGSGGMGDVYKAEHRLLRRPSVIKLIRPDQARDPKALKRFEREVRLLATLTHWNTVDVYDYGHTPDGTFYYVMEYLPGLDLDQVVSRFGPLPPGRVVYLLRQICRGLREAHASGLIHRDVKPSNVIVCQRGGESDVAKLLDFGLVRTLHDDPTEAALTGEQIIIGTPAFLSPEQACGKPVDARSDIYSLGATAHYLLIGRPPFVKDRAIELIAAHLTEAPEPLAKLRPDVPPCLSGIILRCLAKQPADRYPDIRELEKSLGECASAQGWSEDHAAKWWAVTKPI